VKPLNIQKIGRAHQKMNGVVNLNLKKVRTPKMSNNLPIIREKVLGDAAIQVFADNLPNAMGDQAKKAAARYAKMVYAVVSTSTDLQKCTPKSIIRESSKAASLDLEFDQRGLVYLVPFKNKKGDYEAQLIIGYMGLMELAYRSNKVKAINAHCIYESERETIKIERINGRYNVEHPFSFDPPKGKMIAVYATADVEGFGPQTMVLRIDQVEFFRNKSKAPNSPAWKDFYEAMAKKTAVRQLAKFLPKTAAQELTKAIALEEKEDYVDAQIRTDGQIEDDAGSEPIDVQFENGETAQKEESVEDLPAPDPAIVEENTNEETGEVAEFVCNSKQCNGKRFTADMFVQIPGKTGIKFHCPYCRNSTTYTAVEAGEEAA